MLVTGRRNQNTRKARVIDCKVVLMLPWSSTAIAGQEHFCFCSFKLMRLCAHLSCCLLPRRKTRKMNWARNTLKLLAFYPRNWIKLFKVWEQRWVGLKLVSQMEMEQCQVQAFPLCLPLHSRPLVMLSFTAQKGGLKCWFNVGPKMDLWSSAFPNWNVCFTELRYRLCWAMSWVSKSCERTVTLSQDHGASLQSQLILR